MTDTKLGAIEEGWIFVHLYKWPTVVIVVMRGRALVIGDRLGTEMGRFSSPTELEAGLRLLGLDPRPALATLVELQLNPEIEKLYMDARAEKIRAEPNETWEQEQERAQTSLLRGAWGPYQYKQVLDRLHKIAVERGALLFPEGGSEPDGG